MDAILWLSETIGRNFICDFILGVQQPHTLPSLFD